MQWSESTSTEQQSEAKLYDNEQYRKHVLHSTPVIHVSRSRIYRSKLKEQNSNKRLGAAHPNYIREWQMANGKRQTSINQLIRIHRNGYSILRYSFSDLHSLRFKRNRRWPTDSRSGGDKLVFTKQSHEFNPFHVLIPVIARDHTISTAE